MRQYKSSCYTLLEKSFEAYNIKNDTDETKDVAKNYPKIRTELFKKLENQIKFDQ